MRPIIIYFIFIYITYRVILITGLGGNKQTDSKSNFMSLKFSSSDYFNGSAISGKLWTTADIYANGTLFYLKYTLTDFCQNSYSFLYIS